MAGEMYSIDPVTGMEPDGTVWKLHAAIAKAVGGTVQPFDQYQGPYVLVGEDIRFGHRPYQYIPRGLGVIRLWIACKNDAWATVYREDTQEESSEFPMYDEGSSSFAAEAALEVMHK